VIEVDRNGKETLNAPAQLKAARKMSDGKIVGFNHQNGVVQMDSSGQILTTTQVFCGGGGHNEVTDSGHVLALSPGNGNIIEFDADGKEVGHYDYQGAMYGFRLPGGHTFVTHESQTEYLELDENWKLVKSTSLDVPTMKVKKH